jgi:hypothetical protein
MNAIVGILPASVGPRSVPLHFFSSFLDAKKGTARHGASGKKLVSRAVLLNNKTRKEENQLPFAEINFSIATPAAVKALVIFVRIHVVVSLSESDEADTAFELKM